MHSCALEHDARLSRLVKARTNEKCREVNRVFVRGDLMERWLLQIEKRKTRPLAKESRAEAALPLL